jgi:uncharacterized protein
MIALPLEQSLIQYPCDFPIKVMGHAQAGFTKAVIEIISRHDQRFEAASTEVRTSKHAKYLSLTCIVKATSREQLDKIYQELCDHPMVVMAL